MNRPKVGISSCLLGEAVRYDGGHRRHAWIADVLAAQVDLVPFCPEVAIGLGVPRLPIQLVRDGDALRALGVEDPALDVTARLREYARTVAARYPDLCGYIFKARSPSCGLGSTPVFEAGRETGELTAGLFAAELQRALPDLPVIEETALDDPETRQAFIQRVFAKTGSETVFRFPT